jgi:protein-S-isoprenylcysteine O-methyltransferase Ste14
VSFRVHDLAIRIGNFFFRYRNGAFPIVVVALYALVAPPRDLFGSETLEHVKDLLALGIAMLGLGVRASVIGYAYIKRGGRGKRVYAADLVTDGIFGLCRNPLYVGNLLICLGTFLMHGSPVVLILGTAFYVIVYQCIVLAEEAYLAAKFGDAYRAYCRDVPRWIPKLGGFREATAGMRFNVRRVVLKDYTTIATTVTVLALTEFYEEWYHAAISAHPAYLAALAAIVVLCGLFTLGVRTVKKRSVAGEA